MLLLAGCDTKVAPDAPLTWWHDLEGGTVANQRPPPPGVNDPYPNVATVPARPVPTDLLSRQRIADSLAAQRDQAEAQAAGDPLSVKPLTPAPPRPPPKVDLNASTETLDAVTPPPAPVGPPPAPVGPRPAPVAAVAAPAAPPPASAAAAPAPVTQKAVTAAAVPVPAIGSVAQPAAAVASGPVPPLAAAPPTLPAVEGYTPPLPPPVAAAAPPAAAPVANTVQVAFSPGSSTLPPSAPFNLRKFALQHKGVPVIVVGHGESVQPNADAQGQALELGLKRAQAIAASLTEAGIPAANLRLSADAAGTGGVARLN